MRTEEEYHEAYRRIIRAQDSLLLAGKRAGYTKDSYHTGHPKLDARLQRLYHAQTALEIIMAYIDYSSHGTAKAQERIRDWRLGRRLNLPAYL